MIHSREGGMHYLMESLQGTDTHFSGSLFKNFRFHKDRKELYKLMISIG